MDIQRLRLLSPKQRAELSDLLRRLRDFHHKHGDTVAGEAAGREFDQVVATDSPTSPLKKEAQQPSGMSDSSAMIDSLCSPTVHD